MSEAAAGLPPLPDGVRRLRVGTLEAWVLPYGARLMQLWWLAAPGGARPLSLGFRDPAAYRRDRMSIGAVCGRYANRLAQARLQRGAQTWALDANHPLGHCIHGGREGFGEVDWQVVRQDEASVTLSLDTPDGHMGFPGRCRARVVYRLSDQGLHWRADAELDQPCPLNILQHSYWNLDAQPTLAGHVLQVQAGLYHPTDAQELPLPAQPVAGTAFDFRAPRAIAATDVPLLDGALVVDASACPADAEGLREVAHLRAGGLQLRVRTDRPLLHLYASASLRPTDAPLGVAHAPGAALCLETEDLPNGPALGADVWYGPSRPYQHRMDLLIGPDPA